ncbi:F-box only protein 36a [Neoarius graeffei]|uniref:F-box only protein 36a n=1 Tax=Neoarius graeffei TaxID=443677 RepID=UPI00298CE059|nr:F-box only protein 36a [Neoarius graeffei]
MASLLKELLFENSTQAPPPSKDFHHLAVTKTEVIWRWWKISLRAKSQDLRPGEMKLSHQEFLGNTRLQQQIGLVFGSKFLDYTVGLCEGRFDYLERLSDNLLQHIISYLNFHDICHLSETSHRFKKLCDSLELWEEAVRRCNNEITPEIQRLAKKFSWKMIYITFCHNRS